MSDSLMQQIAALSEAERAEILKGYTPEQLLYDWGLWGRPEQFVPQDNEWNIFALLGGRGAGKEASTDTPVPTPDGYTALGDLSVGDVVFDEHGQPCNVTALYDNPRPRACYRMTFSDKTTLEVGADHQWVTWTHRDRKQYLRKDKKYPPPPPTNADFPEDWVNYRGIISNRFKEDVGQYGAEIRTTEDIIDTFRIGSRRDLNHCIPVAGPLKCEDKDLPVDSWVLGYHLGNGQRGTGFLCAGSYKGDMDEKHVAAELDRAGYTYSVTSCPEGGYSTLRVKRLLADLENAGLGGQDKFIPAIYFRASVEQRRQLLHGLMDSDGYIDQRKSMAEFCSMDRELAEGVLQLVRSLSERPVLATGRAMFNGRDYGTKYRVTWRPSFEPPFNLPRKALAWAPRGAQGLRVRHRMITKIEEIPLQPMRCITVDSPNSMYLLGEGMIPTHNTRATSEWIREVAKQPTARIALVSRTAADVRDVLVFGESGILNITPEHERPLYEPSKRLITWPSGATALCFSAETPDQLRGPQFTHGVAEEVATWPVTSGVDGLTAFDNLKISVRLGNNPQILIATTPKRTIMLRKLLKEAEEHPRRVRISRSSTRDNAGNLSRVYLDNIYGMYAGTRIGAQELDGLMLDDVEGALWDTDNLDLYRVQELPAEPRGGWLKIVGVDPTVAQQPTDSCGIIVVYCTRDRDLYKRQAYVVEDLTTKGSPDQWTKVVVAAAERHGAIIVAEKNQGHELVRKQLMTTGFTGAIKMVWSVQGKALRAEPISTVYEQGRVHHVGFHPMLESQMTTWTPADSKSPDEVDSLCHALTACLIKIPAGGLGGGGRIYGSSRRGQLRGVTARPTGKGYGGAGR